MSPAAERARLEIALKKQANKGKGHTVGVFLWNDWMSGTEYSPLCWRSSTKGEGGQAVTVEIMSDQGGRVSTEPRKSGSDFICKEKRDKVPYAAILFLVYTELPLVLLNGGLFGWK